MDHNIKFPYLTDEQKNAVDSWFSDIGNKETCIQSIDVNPFYFLSKMLLCENKEKRINALCLLSLSSKLYCKDLFVRNFNKIIIRIDDLVIFLDTIKTQRGFGKIIRKAVQKWFKSKDAFKLDRLLSYNYGNTSWTNRDILCCFHIKPWDKQINLILKKYSQKEKTPYT